MEELIALMEKFVALVESSPSNWKSGYPELANEYRQAIEAAQQSVQRTAGTGAEESVAKQLAGRRKSLANRRR